MAHSQVLEGTVDEIAAELRKVNPIGGRLKVMLVPDQTQEDNEPQKRTSLQMAVARMTKRTPEQIAEAQARAIATYLPQRAAPPGKTLADVVCGQWPGDETDEQIEAALIALS